MYTKIYTSYIANIKRTPSDIVPISIALKCIQNIPCYNKLAPSPNILFDYKTTGDFNSFVENYRSKVLSALNPQIVVRDLFAITRSLGGSIPCLVCFEGSDKPCHRHVVAEWLRHSGYSVEELKYHRLL